jgi:hypothetical protein
VRFLQSPRPRLPQTWPREFGREEGFLELVSDGMREFNITSFFRFLLLSLALRFSFEAEFSGELLDGSELLTQMKVADIVSMVGLKGHALGRILKLEKDCYDLYAICGFTAGNPVKAADEFRLRFKPENMNEKRFIEEALKRIGGYFGSENGRGPLAVSRFYGTDEARRVDSYQRLHTFLKNVQ